MNCQVWVQYEQTPFILVRKMMRFVLLIHLRQNNPNIERFSFQLTGSTIVSNINTNQFILLR
jgi:hypothetical protein